MKTKRGKAATRGQLGTSPAGKVFSVVGKNHGRPKAVGAYVLTRAVTLE